MTIRWSTGADRQDVRDAAEERRVLDELVREYATHVVSAEERAERIAHHRTHRDMGTLRIDPYRRG